MSVGSSKCTPGVKKASWPVIIVAQSYNNPDLWVTLSDGYWHTKFHPQKAGFSPKNEVAGVMQIIYLKLPSDAKVATTDKLNVNPPLIPDLLGEEAEVSVRPAF